MWSTRSGLRWDIGEWSQCLLFWIYVQGLRAGGRGQLRWVLSLTHVKTRMLVKKHAFWSKPKSLFRWFDSLFWSRAKSMPKLLSFLYFYFYFWINYFDNGEFSLCVLVGRSGCATACGGIVDIVVFCLAFDMFDNASFDISFLTLTILFWFFFF